MPRIPTKNLTAARAIARSVHEPDATTTAIVVLAVTLARTVDDAAAGGQPGYVLAKLAATYGDTLRTLSELVGPRLDNSFDELLRNMAAPRFGDLDAYR